MTDMTGPAHLRESIRLAGRAEHYTYGDGGDPVTGNALATQGLIHAVNANTAMLAALVTAVSGGHEPYELDAWREVIPLPPLKECKGKETRRPECAERHTEDCRFAEPPPEPPHELLPVGTRVLVADWRVNPEGELRLTNPQAGRISGHAAGGHKYRWQYEFEPGIYSDHDQFAFADNRVEVHPDGPECPPKPIPTGSFEVGTTWRMRKPNTGPGKGEFVTITRRTRDKKTDGIPVSFDRGADMPKDYRHDTWPAGKFVEWFQHYEPPTGPALFVQHVNGKQGQVVGLRTQSAGVFEYQVRWFKPAKPVTWVPASQTHPIDADDLYRCPNGQTGDECGSGENQCERCLADEDAEAEAIEGSMNV